METQESLGKPFSIGTKNWIHPDQCAKRDMMQIKFKKLANTLAKSANCNEIKTGNGNQWISDSLPVTH